MKKQILLLLSTIILNSQLLMAIEGTSAMNAETPDSATLFTKGFHIGAVMAPTNFSATSNGNSGSHFQISAPMALSLGYTSLANRNFGWSTQLNFSALRDPNLNSNVAFLRWDGSLAYSINSIYALKAGPTVTRRFGASKFSRTMNDLMRSHGLGFQLSVAAKVSPRLLVNLGYSQTTVPNLAGDGFRINGPELEMAYLF